MYTREIQQGRDTPIENGAPIHGTWTQAFHHVDLLEIQRPFALPLPRALVDFRIKEWVSFSAQDDNFFIHAFLYNIKIFRGAEVLVFNKESGDLLRFRKTLPFSGWHLPRSLSNASVESRSYGFFFRVHTWLDAHTIRVDLDIEATKKRLPFTAHLTFDMDKKTVTPMAVNLLFSERRSMYAFKAVAPVRGDMVFDGKYTALDPAKTTGIFGDFKGFYPYNTNSIWCSAMGFEALPNTDSNMDTASAPRRIGFNIAETQVREPNHSNENALWIDGALTPLPPVRITMPRGSEGAWVIQDVEGMVDLTFTPEKPVQSSANFILVRAEYETPLGYFNGMLLNSKGESIPIRNMRGMGEKLRLRV
jgi:hypothetical protein